MNAITPPTARGTSPCSDPTCMQPTKDALGAIASKLQAAHRTWSPTRCTQRAVVEWFKRGAPCA